MNSRIRGLGFASIALGLVFAVAPDSRGATVYAFNLNGGLVSFDSSSPGALLSNVSITGLQANENLLGIDFRPANGLLYGLTDQSRIYTINTTTGAATLSSNLSTPLPVQNGYGTDFNPTVDRLRITGSNGINLRVNVDTGAVTIDTPLSYAPGDPHFGTPPSIGGSAYSNNTAGAPTTTLYDLDIELNLIAIQNPPNAGTLNTVGPTGIVSNSIERAGLDIVTDSGGTNQAFAFMSTQNDPNGFYTVNLGTGAVTLVGDIGGLRVSYVDIAAQLAPTPPGGGGGVPLPPAALIAIPGAALALVRARRLRAQ